MSAASTARRVSFRDVGSYPSGKELAVSYHKFGDSSSSYPADGTTKRTFKPHPGSGRPGRYRPPLAPPPPKPELLHKDDGEAFSWQRRTTSAKTVHGVPDRNKAMGPAAGLYWGVKGPGTNLAMHADDDFTPHGYRTLNDKELPSRRVQDAHTPSAPTLMRDFMNHGDRLNEPRPGSSYRRHYAGEMTDAVHDAAEHFDGTLSFRRHRPRERDTLAGSASNGELRYRPTTANAHRGEPGEAGQPSANPLYTARGHCSVPQGDRVQSAIPKGKVQEDFPPISLHNHRPYSRSRAFPDILGTNAQLGDDRFLPHEDRPTTARDYPEKNALEPITRAPPGKKNFSVLPENDEDPPRDQQRRRLTSAKVDFRQPPSGSHPEHVPFINVKNFSNIAMPLSADTDTFSTTNQRDYANIYRAPRRADPPPSYNVPLDYGFGPGSSMSKADFANPQQDQVQPVDPRAWDQLHRSHWKDEEEQTRQLSHHTHTVLSHRPMTSHRARPDTGRIHRSNLPMYPEQFQFQPTALSP